MGWWEAYNGIVIGDEFADIMDGHKEAVVDELRRKFPDITKEQVLHTVVFCFGYLPAYDGKEPEDGDMVLQAMTRAERKEWVEQNRVPLDESKLVAPGTGLMNAKNPFTGDIV